jgi:predicted 3-demethylubiquinone-9 3-methyltransferase (glyoxalase superfamily)
MRCSRSSGGAVEQEGQWRRSPICGQQQAESRELLRRCRIQVPGCGFPTTPAGRRVGQIVEFTLFGQPFQAISAGPLDPFNHAVSFIVNCGDQAEVDRYWNALLDGGKAEQCGWLKDRYGLSWQIVPTALGELMTDPDRAKAKRVGDAMLKMVKLDIAKLEAAAEGGK